MVLTSSLYHKKWTKENKPLMHAYCSCSAGNLQMAMVHTVSCSSLSCLASPLLPLRHWLLQTDMQGVPRICCGPPQGVIHSHVKSLLNLHSACTLHLFRHIDTSGIICAQATAHCTAVAKYGCWVLLPLESMT